jgi:hypothetical protein
MLACGINNAALTGAGLPDGLLANQKFKSWSILDGLGMEHVGRIYEHLEFL